GGVAG
ncbi:hypothetical protein A2U01_0083169, partial [Trifolium medium]